MSDFLEKVESFQRKLLDRGYNLHEITPLRNKIDHSSRQELLHKQSTAKTEPPLVFKLIFSPHIYTKDLKSALTVNWELIKNHANLKTLFPTSPVIAYKRTNNLKNILVKAALRCNVSEEKESKTLDKNYDDLDTEMIKILQGLEDNSF